MHNIHARTVAKNMCKSTRNSPARFVFSAVGADKDRLEAERSKQLPILQMMHEDALYQIKHDRDFALENPFSSLIWKNSPLASLLALSTVDAVVFDVCRFGAADLDSGQAIRKKTQLIKRSSWKLRGIALRCICVHSHTHIFKADTLTALLARLMPQCMCQVSA